MTTEPISSEAVTGLLKRLPKATLDDAPPTYLPTILPLALPTPEHTLNFFTTLHLIHHALAQPIHAAYFHETRASPRDTAIRGIVSLFLASEESWTSANMLSAAAWKKGKLDERAIAEHFEIQVIREREHETMKAIRVGERWDKAVGVAQALVGLFAQLGEGLSGKSVGEAVLALVEESQEVANGDVAVFARVFTEQAAKLVPGTSQVSTEDVLPSAPLHLLQDLAYRQSESKDLGVSLPPPDELSDVSPLPLSVSVLLQTGIISLDQLPETDSKTIKSALPTDFDFASLSLGSTPSTEPAAAISVSQQYLDDLARLSLSASSEIRFATQTQDWAGEEEWKSRLTFHDIWRIFTALEGKVGKGFTLVGGE